MEEDIATAGSPALLLVHSRVIGMEWNQQMVRACPMKAFTNRLLGLETSVMTMRPPAGFTSA